MATRVLIVAGGTGGHILPGLTVARELQKAQVEVHWLGTPKGLENQLLSQTNIPVHHISVSGLRGKTLREKLLVPFQLVQAIIQAMAIIRRLKPKLLVGFGGFVSGPGAIAAILLRTPFIISEQNSIAGLTNRYLASYATRVMQAFPNTFPARLNPQTIGNPIREEILRLPAPEQRFTQSEGPLRLLILGGSQGAAIFNQVVPEALGRLSSTKRPQIWHIAGRNKVADTQTAYQKLFVSARVDEYVHDMASAYAWADIVLCRAGALSIFEIAAAGVASILVPYPYAVDDHQTHNASYLVEANAAILLPQSTLSVKRLSDVLTELMQDKTRLLEMAKAAYALRKPDATREVVCCCID